MTAASVLVLEPDERVAWLVVRYLTDYGIQSRVVAGRLELQIALTLAGYTCVIAGPYFENDSVVAALCLDAGTPLVIATRFSGPELMARIGAVSRVLTEP